MKTIKIGDHVIVKERASYNFTRAGSKGHVKSIDGSNINVEFYYITGHFEGTVSKSKRKVWAIHKNDLEHLEQVPDIPYGEVIHKIKVIQERRKEQGYAF